MDKVKGVEIDPVREKLIELFKEAERRNIDEATSMTMEQREELLSDGDGYGFYADHLIASGVVVSKMETTTKWIPVTERLPETIPCGAGTAYSEAVNVLTDGRKVLTAIWNGTHWICDAEFWDAEFEEITHWTPVLLPLPEPPKGE